MDSLEQATTGGRSVAPVTAARMLGVSDRQAERLMVDGRLPTVDRSGSTQRTILVRDIQRLAAQRTERRTHTDAAIDALLGDLDY